MKSLAEVLSMYPDLQKGYFDSNVNYRTWLPINMSPSFIVQAFCDAKRYPLFDQSYKASIELGKITKEFALLRCGIEKCLVKVSAFWKVNVGDKYKDGPKYYHTEAELAEAVKLNKTWIKTEVLLKHFGLTGLKEMLSNGDLIQVLFDRYGREFIIMLLENDNIISTEDVYLTKLFSLGGMAYMAYFSLPVDKQTYLRNFTPEQLHACYIVGVQSYIDRKFTSYSAFPNIYAAQLAYGMFLTYGNWCGEVNLTIL
jgi:hypothetical protein